MNFRVIHKKIIVFICIINLIFINSNCVYGATTTEFIPSNIEKTTNGANLQIYSNKTDEYYLDVTMNTKGLDGGYYTGYLYENKNRDWSSYEAISFNVNNESDSPIRINLNIKRNDDIVFSPSNDSEILVRRENNEIMERIHPSYGTIELPEDFNGTLYIPFNSFKEEGKSNLDNVNKISKISSWGIVVTQSENEEKSFKLSKFSLITKGSDLDKYFNLNFSIKGDTSVEIPVVGESISNYKVEYINEDKNINNNTIKFKLKEPVEGITINENGRLTLTSDVGAQKVQICAEVDENLSEIMNIQLIKSWTVTEKALDGTSKSIPAPNEVSILTKNEKGLLTNNNILIGMRVIIILSIIVFVALYCVWKKNEKK